MAIPYTRQKTWVDNTLQQVDSIWLNAIEDTLVKAMGVAPATNGALVWDGATFRADAGIKNANVDSAAAIAYSKLALAGSIVNADIAGGAAIAKSKLAALAIADADVSAGAAIALSKLASVPVYAPYRKVTPKTVNTTVTATDLLNGEITIGANVMGATGLLRLTAFGDWVNNSGGTVNVPRLSLVFGGTTIIDFGTGATATTSANRGGWKVVFEILNLTATSQTAFGIFMQGIQDTVAGSVAPNVGEGGGNSSATMTTLVASSPSTAVDTTAAKTLVLNVVNGSASATYETKLLGAIVEVI